MVLMSSGVLLIYPRCQMFLLRNLQGCILETSNSYYNHCPSRPVLLPGGARGRRAAGALLRDVPAGRRHLRRQGGRESGFMSLGGQSKMLRTQGQYLKIVGIFLYSLLIWASDIKLFLLSG